MKTEKALVNVSKGQDAYSVIGNYISNHVTAIEDMIAVIQINGYITNELYMVDMKADGYFYWESDWWEGEEDVALIDFFPVSEAERPQEWVPVDKKSHPDTPIRVQVQLDNGWIITAYYEENEWLSVPDFGEPIQDKWIEAWRPLSEAYKAESEDTE